MITGSREDLRDKVDWIGVNYYSRLLVKPSKTPGFFDIVKGAGLYCNSKEVSITGRPCSDMGWEVYPEGLSKVLEEVWSKYRKPLIVTENGIADSRDVYRPKFLISHISHLSEISISSSHYLSGFSPCRAEPHTTNTPCS
jgi:beta-galactosidase